MQEIEAEPERAAYALEVAASLLGSAKEMAEKSSFDEAIVSARDSMRMAGSALLFKDGLVSTDLDSSCQYLAEKYGSELPVDEWRRVEQLTRTSFIDKLADIFGSSKNRLEKNADLAMEAAHKFLSACSMLILS
jgi:hypothetical protein